RSAPRALLPALLPLQPHQKAIGQHDGDGMAMKPFPEPALVLIPAQQLFSFFMILLHPGTTMDILDHDREGSMSREVTPIVFAVTRLAAPGPLADQPAEVGCPIPIHAPAAQGDKLAPQRARTALPPGDCLPVTGRERSQHGIHPLAFPLLGSRQPHPEVCPHRYAIAL